MTTITTSTQVPSYKIISINTATLHMIVQFEGDFAYNYRIPTYNGSVIYGDMLNMWLLNSRIEQINLGFSLNNTGSLTGWDQLQALVDPTGYPNPNTTSTVVILNQGG